MSYRYNKGRGGEAGATLFESAVVAIIVAVLGGVLLSRLLYYEEQAELAAVARTANALRAALNLRVAQLYASDGQAALPALAAQNPINWLAEKPANYAGEFYAPAPADVAAGQWYFDRSDGTLVYLTGARKSFLRGQATTLKFKVSLLQDAGKMTQAAGRTIVLDQVLE